MFSDMSESFTFYEKVFNSAGCLTCYTLRLLFLFEYKGMWPMCNWDKVTYSFLDFLNSGLESPRVDLIKKGLLQMLLFWCFCHFLWINLYISGFKSIHGILNLSGTKSRAHLAAESTLSLSLTPTWLGIQHMRISLELDMESNHFSSLKIKKYSSFLKIFFNDIKTQSRVWGYNKFFVVAFRDDV